jgi:fibronectin-binding autotransporter adhesin
MSTPSIPRGHIPDGRTRVRMRSRAWLQGAYGALGLCLVALPCHSQSVSAGWVGGSGNWSNQNNWSCTGSGGSSVPCIPSSSVLAQSPAGSDINVDINASVYQFGGDATSLTLNGTSLDAVYTVALSAGSSVSIDTGSINSLNLAGTLSLGFGKVGTGGAPSALDLTGSSTIGNSDYTGMLGVASGTLSVTATSSLTTSAAFIGTQGDASMTVAGTVWNLQSGGTLQIGGSGANGALTLGSFAVLDLNNQSSIVLGAANGNGMLTVDSGGSITTPSGTSAIQIGSPNPSGAGALDIASGGAVSVGRINMLGTSSALATLTVDGKGASLTVATGGITVDAGSVVASDGAQVSLQGSGSGLFLQSGKTTLESGATLASDGSVVVGSVEPAVGAYPGSSGVASLQVEDGASASNANYLVLASNKGSSGSMTLQGDGSTWTNAGAVVVGYFGNGSLAIQEGGVLSSGPDSNGVSGYVGWVPGGVGTVTIDGDDSAWNQTGALYVGDLGTGTLTVQNKGNLNTGSNAGISAAIGVGTSGTGTVTVTGDDSSWDAAGLVQVGAAGTGTLNIADSAEVTAPSMSVGALSGGQGTIAMTGGALTIAGTLTIGDAGHGVLTVMPNDVDDEGDVTSLNGVVGAQLGSNGQVTLGSIQGTHLQTTASQWTIQQGLIVGEAGSGSINLGGTLLDLQADLGQTTTGNGSIIVQNGGSWTSSNGLIVGDAGLGSVTIQAGGFVNVKAGIGAILGNQVGSRGTMDVQGQLNLTQALIVGASGSGTLTVEGGGAIASADGYVGENAGATGTVTLTGHGTQGASIWSVDGTLYVGQSGTGTVTVESGAELMSRAGSVGSQTGSNGTVLVTGAGSLWSATLAQGTGMISIGGSGTGSVSVQDGGRIAATDVIVSSGGILNGQGGSVAASILNEGGTVTPGDATGLLTVTGNYKQNSGITVFEIDGASAGEIDELHVSGNVALSGGSISVIFADGFAPSAGESFDLITAAALNGSVPVTVSGLPAGYTFNDEFTSTGFDLVAGSGSKSGPAPAPEPASGYLLLCGLGVWSIFVRRRTPMLTT